MVNEAQISLTGYVATQPVTKPVAPGVKNVSMRVAWTPRWRDRSTGDWVDGNTSYVTVVCWRKLAANAAVSLRTGDPVVVMGRLSVRTFSDRNGVRKTAVDIDANTVGHDLSRGISEFQRVRPKTGMTAAEFEAAQAGGGAGAAAAHGDAAPGPDGSVADQSMADQSVADGSGSNGSVSNGSVSNGSVSNGSVSNGSVADWSVPGEPVPGESVPGESVPGESVPGGSVADEPAYAFLGGPEPGDQDAEDAEDPGDADPEPAAVAF